MNQTAIVWTDAQRGVDPTGTSKLRAMFRSAGRLQLRQLRAQLRRCIIDNDLLGLGGINIAVMASAPDIRLAAFNHWLTSAANKYLHRDWAVPYVDKAWRDGAAAAASEVRVLPHVHNSQVMQQLLYQELNGIIAVIVQQVGREAGRNYSSAHKAYQHLSAVFDKVADNRIVTLCNTLVVAAYNKAKIAVYRQANVKRIGVIPERVLKPRVHDAYDPDEPRDPQGRWGFGTGGSGKKRTTEKGKPLPAHIAAVRIPPAWTEVRYNPDPKGALLVTGKDAKGRRQSVYSAAHEMKQAAVKFARIKELSNKIKSIEQQNNQSKDNASSDCVRLIMHTGIRPGSDADTGAATKAYGATTLEGRHVKKSGDKVKLSFVGKKGVKLDLPIEDKAVANMLVARATKAGSTGRLFGDLTVNGLRDYVHTLNGGGFKVKDFRTLVGTTLAANTVTKMPIPKNPTNYKKAVREVAQKVSTKLGNTPTVALQSYINPSVFSSWRMSSGQHMTADEFPDAHFGAVDMMLPDWRHEHDQPDPDDEEIETPIDVSMMLGFDPKDLFNDADPDRESKQEYRERLREQLRTERGEAFEVGVKTAEDDFVCQECQDYADGAPYDIDDAEDDIPLHANCRCTMYPWPEDNGD